LTDETVESGLVEGTSETLVLRGERQEALVALLTRGASPFAACRELDLPYAAYVETFAVSAAFRARIAEVRRILSENVVAAMYQTAMKGSVPAQTAWLKANPPPGWESNGDANESDFLDGLSSDDLFQLARALGIDVSEEIEGISDCGAAEDR
jgi:hypothetical protein